MKKNTENFTSDNKYEFEEIADIPEIVADEVIIDGRKDIDDDSIVEIDLHEFEELGEVDSTGFKSMTIVDEFERSRFSKTNNRKDSYPNDNNGSIDIRKLSFQIDSLTSVNKNYNAKKTSGKGILRKKPEIDSLINEKLKNIELTETESKQEEPKVVITEEKEFTINKPGGLKFIIESEDKDWIQNDIVEESSVPELLVQKEKSEQEEKLNILLKEIREEKSAINNAFNDNIQETIIKQFKEIKKDIYANLHEISQTAGNETAGAIKFRLYEEEALNETCPESPAVGQRNSVIVDIPDKLLKELPDDFDIDEFGKIDLNEAETIAEEDMLSLTDKKTLEDLEGLDIFLGSNFNLEEKEIEPAKPEKKKAKDGDIKESPEEIKSEKTDANIDLKRKENIADEISEHVNKIITEEKIEPAAVEFKESEKALNNINGLDQPLLAHGDTQDDQAGEPDFKDKIEDERVLFLDDDNNSKKEDFNSQTDELDNISSSAADVIAGEPKQLTESETTGRKAVTGLIRDNYPAFKDLLKEKEAEEQHQHYDDDIMFVDNSFVKRDREEKVIQMLDDSEDVSKNKIEPHANILGLIPEEMELIEDQLFKIKDKKIDLEQATLKIFYDQHPNDAVELEKFKYILPVPDSLLKEERKSIEDEILAKSALIFEEDVDKIKKKLEDSMGKKIEETIQDITNRITIYEDNKSQHNDENGVAEKEDIIKLLRYLDELMEDLPEPSINKFVESDYYELYKKVLENMDK